MTLRRASAAPGPAPSYEGDDRTDQEHSSGSDRDNSNPLPDPALFPFIRRHVTSLMFFSTSLASHLSQNTPIVELKYPLATFPLTAAGPSSSQSPIRNSSSHCRNSRLKPMLSATRKLEMTHRSICLPDLPAVSHVRRYSLRD
jgi:hypothetical protein